MFCKPKLRLAYGTKTSISSFVRFQVLFLRICTTLTLWACTFSVLIGVTLNLPELESFQPFLSPSSPYRTGNFGNKNWSCMELQKSFISAGQIEPMNGIRQHGNLRMTYKITQTNSFSNPVNRDQRST